MLSIQRITQRARDPRILLGTVLVLGGGVVGGLLAQPTQSVYVPQASVHIAAGDHLTAEQFTFVEMPQDLAASYVHGSHIPQGSFAQRALAPGEFLPKATIGTAKEGNTIALSLAAPVSSDLKPGQEVTIWRIPHHYDGQASIVAQHALFVLVHETRAMTDGRPIVDVRLNDAGIAGVITALGNGDEFIIVAEGSN
ncbi:SAF domain-containing protein [Arcanobacterium pinnipediorum]|uniref:SAF domain-containing protein n=1 Tax=Arcanobacterium pinnipediorum TaxID=1503041 RepID=A0ABY5AJQ2_9ACTO|nr:SAF domain-containing protein [Arcanobacterium pinnipediorum]USR79666.1 hypothetical protein NG665_01350 [Arcanobacterium pinnipediorum]